MCLVREHLSDGGADLYGFFFDGLRVSLMPGYHIHFIALDFPMEFCLWFSGHYPLAQLPGHFLNVAYIEVQLPGNLAVR